MDMRTDGLIAIVEKEGPDRERMLRLLRQLLGSVEKVEQNLEDGNERIARLILHNVRAGLGGGKMLPTR